MKPLIYLGTDHAAYTLKESVKAFLQTEGYEVVDCGALSFDSEDDYPDFVSKAAQAVATAPGSRGIVFGKSGAGECMVANKVPGVRAFLAVNEENVRLAREHNDATVMSIGSSLLSEEQAKQLLLVFLATPFSGEERHVRRLAKITALEKSYGA